MQPGDADSPISAQPVTMATTTQGHHHHHGHEPKTTHEPTEMESFSFYYDYNSVRVLSCGASLL
jgi:hypothetical protein